MSKPTIFIGSSTEGIDIADGIETNLQYNCDPRKWPNVFGPGFSNLGTLIQELEKADFAAFVFSPDDIVKMRGKTYNAARDNVIFELGLFMGRLGRKRTFIICPQNQDDFHLPSDLDGIGKLKYDESKPDYKLKTSIVCNEIKRIVRELGGKEKNGKEGEEQPQLKIENHSPEEKRKTLKDELNSSSVRVQIIKVLAEKYLQDENITITKLNKEYNFRRKLVVDLLNELHEVELLVKGKNIDKKVEWKLNQDGFDFSKKIK